MSTQTELILFLLLALLLLPHLIRTLYFLHSHLRQPSLPLYLHSPHSYALITGASDGIGRALALEFAKWGFNIILHGRNPPKLAKVREEILALQKEKEKKKGKGKDVLLWVQDAAEDVDWPAVRKRFEQLEITVLVNNVGGSKLQTLSFDQQPLADVTRTVHINALFPFWLTHTLLPLLRQPYPTLLLNVGSMAGVIPPPHFAAYAGSKAFLDRFTHALDLDERISGSQVKVHYLQTATVLNSSGVMRRSLTVPSAEEYARGAVRVVGGTRRVVFPYWMHGLQAAVVGVLGEGGAERLMIWAMRQFEKQE